MLGLLSAAAIIVLVGCTATVGPAVETPSASTLEATAKASSSSGSASQLPTKEIAVPTPTRLAIQTTVPTEEPTKAPTATKAPVKPGVADAIIGDPKYLIGDGQVSSSPVNGSVYACNQNFGGGGASGIGDWIMGD